MTFDLMDMPFSRFGSYLTFSRYTGNSKPALREIDTEGIYLRSVYQDGNIKELFGVKLLYNGGQIPYTVEATPTLLKLKSSYGQVRICMGDENLINISGKGVGLGLYMNENFKGNTYCTAKNRYEINLMGSLKFMFAAFEGELSVRAPWNGKTCETIAAEIYPDSASSLFRCDIEELVSVPLNKSVGKDFEKLADDVKDSFENFCDKMPEVPDKYNEVKEKAAYVNWSSVVRPKGILTRYAMYMSKAHMINLWSWDNCFNALALSYNYPELAWDQLMIPFDLQDSSGALPDVMNERRITLNFCKPPVHGWALRKMMENSDYIDADRLNEIFEPMSRWTDWWFTYRDDDNDGIPQYNHGNDSGWDNSTVFIEMPPVESPDLSAFLIIQMEVLSEIAEKLGLKDKSEMWDRRAKELYEKMISHFIRDDAFIACSSGSHHEIRSESLILYMPLLLGKRLPANIRKKITGILKEEGKFLTEHGFASESLMSSLYEKDGYWRGPIWAPSTMLLVDGLNEAGENELAVKTAEMYCNMCMRSGFAENYNAVTGEGLRDNAYTWSASIFLILAHEYLL